MATSIKYLESLLENKNIQAALKTIRHCEGTSAKDGYQYVFGSSKSNKLRFTDLSKHPNNLQRHNNISSTAAGAYQILYRTYLDLCKTYGFKDFSPHTQDLMCLALFDGLNVLTAISKGKILQDEVMTKLSGTWASLPFAKYGQPTHTVADVRKVYFDNGGALV